MCNYIRRYLYLAPVYYQELHSPKPHLITLCAQLPMNCLHPNILKTIYEQYLILILYAVRFGVIFNMGWLVYGDFKAGFEMGPWWQRLFNGYSITTWIVVFNLGSTGLLVSWLMKYSDNIVKVRSSNLDYACQLELQTSYSSPNAYKVKLWILFACQLVMLLFVRENKLI